MKLFKLLFAAAGATVLLGTLVATASAGRLSISNQSIRSTWRSVSFSGLFGETRCRVTLEGSLHARTMIKSIGTLMGYITSAIVETTCQSGSATILRETLPWHVKYSGFREVLPLFESLIVHVIGASWRIREPGGAICLARTTATKPGIGTYHRDPTTGVLTEAGMEGRIPTGAECFGFEGTLEASGEHSGTVSLLGNLNSIVVSLI
jgi:hypothetical protein